VAAMSIQSTYSTFDVKYGRWMYIENLIIWDACRLSMAPILLFNLRVLDP